MSRCFREDGLTRQESMQHHRRRRSMVLAVRILVPVACRPSGYVTSEGSDDDELETVVEDGKPVTVKRLACEIDWLEHRLECYGSIVPNHADVWGQARLMMHRHE